MNKTHIIYIPFTGVGKNPYKGDDWFRDRIQIFKNYTLKSLRNQTNKNYILWLSFRPEEANNPLVEELAKEFEGNNTIVFSYDGLIYFDDRNQENNATLHKRLFRSIERLGYYFKRKEADWIYLTRIDSDDMFHKDVVQLIQDQEPFEGALTLQNGLIYNKDTQEVAEWNPLTNPPFHTLMMKRETFFDPSKHILAYGGFKSHEDIARLKHKVLWRGDNRMDRLYCVFTHNPAMHISTTWEHPFKGKLLDKELIKDFGI